MADVVTQSALGRFYAGRTVLVTGHTGFKGGWLCAWLRMLGANVVGLALPPEPSPTFFEVSGIGHRITSVLGDIRDRGIVDDVVKTHAPELVFHLAAQSLVRRSYFDPVATFATNVMGTVHVLDVARSAPSIRGVIVVTSDKCYENVESEHAYREADPMGGSDPYSASKGCTELVTAAYRRSFYQQRSEAPENGPTVQSARAGNVIGGGDWAEDRLIPDCVRALADGRPVSVRNPDSVRPWQHVLEPLSGYLWLGANLCAQRTDPQGAWNFGPLAHGAVPVRSIADLVVRAWGEGRWEDVSGRQGPHLHEARQLRLDISKATTRLGWQPAWSVEDSIQETITWYRGYYREPRFDALGTTEAQIAAYTGHARDQGLPWALQPEQP